MGFWGTLGKGLLKAAPIAASFIPGVGPLAGALIGAGTGAASGALGGGGLKGAIGGGLGGAAMGKGSSGGFMGPQQQGGFLGKLGGIFGGGSQVPPYIMNMMQGDQGLGPSKPPQMPERMPPQAVPRGQEMRTPNLSNPIEQGRREALTKNPRRQERLRKQPTRY